MFISILTHSGIIKDEGGKNWMFYLSWIMHHEPSENSWLIYFDLGNTTTLSQVSWRLLCAPSTWILIANSTNSILICISLTHWYGMEKQTSSKLMYLPTYYLPTFFFVLFVFFLHLSNIKVKKKKNGCLKNSSLVCENCVKKNCVLLIFFYCLLKQARPPLLCISELYFYSFLMYICTYFLTFRTLYQKLGVYIWQNNSFWNIYFEKRYLHYLHLKCERDGKNRLEENIVG